MTGGLALIAGLLRVVDAAGPLPSPVASESFRFFLFCHDSSN